MSAGAAVVLVFGVLVFVIVLLVWMAVNQKDAGYRVKDIQRTVEGMKSEAEADVKGVSDAELLEEVRNRLDSGERVFRVAEPKPSGGHKDRT